MGGREEAVEDARREARQARCADKVCALQQRLEAEVSREGTAGVTDEEEWSELMREAFGYAGEPASVVMGESNPGQVLPETEAEGPRMWLVRQGEVEARGGEARWLRREDVGEDGYKVGWRETFNAATGDLYIDADGRVRKGGDEVVTVEEAAERGPAVEMAVRARAALGETRVVDHPPRKQEGGGGRKDSEGEVSGSGSKGSKGGERSGSGADKNPGGDQEGGERGSSSDRGCAGTDDKGDDAAGGEAGGNFVNIRAAGEGLTDAAMWAARIGAESVFTLDGSLAKVVAADGEIMVAAWAAVDNQGNVESGALPEEARDNYMAEMAAQLSVAGGEQRRVVIIMDATSPVLALWNFMSKCDRQRQRVYRRDWMDTWMTWLHEFEAVVFLWQTSHVGAPINEWADVEAGKATGALLPECMPKLLPETYGTLELAVGGPSEGLRDWRIVPRGVRPWATQLLTQEVIERLRVTSKRTQVRDKEDMDLPALPPMLEGMSEQLLAGRMQMGDERRKHCAVAKRHIEAAGGCPLGCGCSFTWWDVAFNCMGEDVVEARATWRACVAEASKEVNAELPHPRWGFLQGLLQGTTTTARLQFKAGGDMETAVRRLVGGCVATPLDRQGGPRKDHWMCHTVAAAFEAGMRVQQAAWEGAKWLRDEIREEMEATKLVGPFARRWRMAVIRGGPARAAALQEVRAARREMLYAVQARAARGELSNAECRVVVAAGMLELKRHSLRVRGSILATSFRSAMREWRWLAMVRAWRARRAPRGLPVFERAPEIAARLVGWVRTWELITARRDQRPRLALVDMWHDFAGACAHTLGGLDERSMTPRSKLRWCGGRKVFRALLGHDVRDGLEGDRFGRWAVRALFDVRHPAQRRGRQLEVHVDFHGKDPVTRQPWLPAWLPITWLTADLRRQAREMERRGKEAEGETAEEEEERVTGRKAKNRGLGWEGADEGRVRRSRRVAGEGDGAPATATAVGLPVAAAWPRAQGEGEGCVQTTGHIVAHVAVGWAMDGAGTSTG